MPKYRTEANETILASLLVHARWKSNTYTYTKLLPITEMDTDHIINARKNVDHDHREEYIGSFSSQLWYDLFTFELSRREEREQKIQQLNFEKAALYNKNTGLYNEKAELQHALDTCTSQISANKERIEEIKETIHKYQ